MIRRIIAVVCLSACTLSGGVLAQPGRLFDVKVLEAPGNPSGAPPGDALPPDTLSGDTVRAPGRGDLLLSASTRSIKALLFLQNGNAASGFVKGTDEDGIFARTNTTDTYIRFRELKKITLEQERTNGLGVPIGGVIGLWAGNLAFHRAEHQPDAFLTGNPLIGELLVDVLFAAAGMAVGELIHDQISPPLRTEDFVLQGNLNDLERLRESLHGKLAPTRIHILMQAGKIFSQVDRRYDEILGGTGYQFPKGGNLNLLRRLQVTVSAGEAWEIGASYMLLSVPTIWGNLPGPHYTQQVGVSFDGKGLYAVGMYRPLVSQLPRWFSVDVGAGLGAASMDFEIGTTDYYTSIPLLLTGISKAYLSAVILVDLNLFVTDRFSLGLSADHVFLPSEHIPGVPIWSLPEQELNFGSSSFGISFGVHF